mgnify:CR=1 FL=1
MNIVRSLMESPEIAENPLPPLLPGQALARTTLNALRRPQLVNLAQAFGIKIPKDAPKADILPYMIQAEKAGVFRTKPVSPYHLMLSEIGGDRKLNERERSDYDRALKAAAEEEMLDRPRGPYVKQYPPDGRSLLELQKRASELGINTMGRAAAPLRRLINEAEEASGEAASAPNPNGDQDAAG